MQWLGDRCAVQLKLHAPSEETEQDLEIQPKFEL